MSISSDALSKIRVPCSEVVQAIVDAGASDIANLRGDLNDAMRNVWQIGRWGQIGKWEQIGQ